MTAVRDALWLSAARVAAKVMAFAAGIAVARRLGAAYFGQYSLVLAFLLIFSSLADFGLVSLIIREVAAQRRSAEILLGQAIRLQVIVGTVTALALVACGFLFESDGTIRFGLCVVAVGLYVESLGRPFSGILIGGGHIGLSALAIGATSLFNTIAVLATLEIHPTIVALLAVSIPSGVVAAAVPAILLSRTGVRPAWASSGPMAALLRRAFPFALLAGSVVIYDRVDVVMLAHIAGDRAAGIYSAADRLVDGLLVIPASIGAATYPVMAADPWNSLSRLRPLLVWAIPLVVFITALSIFPGGLIVDKVYGRQFPGAGNTFQILSVLVVLGMGTGCLAYLLQAKQRTFFALVATGVGLVVDVGCNLLLIPRLAFRGSALSALIAESAVLFSLMLFIWREARIPNPMAQGDQETEHSGVTVTP